VLLGDDAALHEPAGDALAQRLELAGKVFHPTLGAAALRLAANLRVHVAQELVVGLRTVESDDRVAGVGVE